MCGAKYMSYKILKRRTKEKFFEILCSKVISNSQSFTMNSKRSNFRLMMLLVRMFLLLSVLLISLSAHRGNTGQAPHGHFVRLKQSQ